MQESRFDKIKYFPASMFGMIMGMAGLSIASLKTEDFISYGHAFGLGMTAFVTVLFAMLLSVYLVKVLRFREAFWEEMRHPVKMNFVPAISISMLLLSIAYHVIGLNDVSQGLWMVGATLHIILTLWVIYHWVHHDYFKVEHSNPTWFIPIVGNIIVPIAGVHYAPADVSWFFFSIGIVFWPILTAILLNRIIFHASMMEKLLPTLFIFIAPPAVGFISYVTLNNGEVDGFAKILYFFALFTTLLMFVSIGQFMKVKFAVSWWAYTFPLAAMSIASLLMAKVSGFMFYNIIAMVILGLLMVMIGWFFTKTVKAAWANKICTAEH
ncbi:MAG: SLAC1 anion channel family protein [Thiomicrorhabdus sp.]|jgi:tellurite resistance protein|nr:SLAC1 anion channel family protein [Thiomicrorhabdus sp.]